MPETLETKQHAAIGNIPHAVTPEEGARLAFLASQIPKGGVIVQIGSYLGQTACYLGCGLLAMGNSGAELHCIDAWAMPNVPRDRPKFEQPGIKERFLKYVDDFGLSEIVRPHEAESTAFAKTWKKPVDLLFIDGGHDYLSCLHDYQAWRAFVKIGGVIAFHDYKPSWPGVMKAIDEIRPDPAWYDWEKEHTLVSATRIGREPWQKA